MKHKFHGDPKRFEVVAQLVNETFGKKTKYIADVAGGQGMLSRILRKQYNYESEVVDPRGYRLTGVPGREEEYLSSMADYYDLVIGLHPDEATRAVAESALVSNTILVPCCNFWNKTKKLGTVELPNAIEEYYKKNEIKYEKIVLDFKGPKNIGFITYV